MELKISVKKSTTESQKLDWKKCAAHDPATAVNEQMFSLYQCLSESKGLIAFFSVVQVDILKLSMGREGS